MSVKGQKPTSDTEAPWIVKSEHPPALHSHVPVIVGLQRGVGFDQAQASRHAEMQDQGARVEADRDVFRAPFDASNGVTANGGFEVGRDRPAQSPFAHDDIDHPPLEQSGCNAASRRFYFRKLGRELSSGGVI